MVVIGRSVAKCTACEVAGLFIVVVVGRSVAEHTACELVELFAAPLGEQSIRLARL